MKQKIITVDTFGNTNLQCVLCDDTFTQARDSKNKLLSDFNPQTLTTKLFLHHWQSLGYCIFANAIGFEVYNKKYLLKVLYDEFNDVKRYKYNVSIMLIHVKDSVLNKIPSLKDKNGILRNIAKILLKTSRRSDIVAHYGDGCFAMVMKHTDLESAKKAAQRIAELLYQTTFFMGEDELDMDMELSVGSIDPESSIEEILSALLDALPRSGKGLKLFETVES